jgi:hypothetical protein
MKRTREIKIRLSEKEWQTFLAGANRNGTTHDPITVGLMMRCNENQLDRWDRFLRADKTQA